MSADRARGALLGMATGDALGAGYEFTTPGPGARIAMIGGGPFHFAPGEWTDDTAMAAGIARAATRHRLDSPAGLDAVVAEFLRWRDSDPKDMGGQTSAVLRGGATTGAAMRAAAEATGPDNAGNGSLMRTAAVPAAFARDTDPSAMLDAAEAVSRLTHTGPYTHAACRLWSVAIWRGIRTGGLPDLHDCADSAVPADQRGRWHAWIDAAEAQRSAAFEHNNGWVVSALQTAWWGIHRTREHASDPQRHVREALYETIRAGHDTDTTAAIAGGLLGAVHGASALPEEWTRMLHGWPGLDAAGLTALVDAAVPGPPN